MGVCRAVEMVLDASLKYEQPICTYGPLIHNPQVLNLLKQKGIRILNGIPDSGSGIVLIRAHGVPPQAKEKLFSAGFNILDATCSRVIKIQAIIRQYTGQSYASIIIGDKDHPEVIGLEGYAGANGYVVGGIDELENLPVFEKAIIVAQTTQNIHLFQSIKEWAGYNHSHYKIFDTICGSTERRQAEVKRLAHSVNALIVVGGRNSGNTRRLVEVSKQTGKPTFHIETEEDLNFIDQDELNSYPFIRIKDVPGSKTILITMAWGILTALLPSLVTTGAINWSNWLVFVWAAGMVFVRTSFLTFLTCRATGWSVKKPWLFYWEKNSPCVC